MSVRERIAPPAAPRLLGGLRDDGRPVSLAAHRERYGLLPLDLSPAELRDRVTASGLTGRGGAGFPTGMKLDSMLRSGRRRIVVANGAEGEPPSGKDKVLLAYAPQLVIDGALLVARAGRVANKERRVRRGWLGSSSRRRPVLLTLEGPKPSV